MTKIKQIHELFALSQNVGGIPKILASHENIGRFPKYWCLMKILARSGSRRVICINIVCMLA